VSERPIFIVGCPRSGTSLLRDLLRSHSRLCIPHESGVIPKLYASYGDPPDSVQARRLATDLLTSTGIASWKLGLDPSQLEHHRSFAGLVRELYSTWAASEGKPRWGDKTPLYVLHLDTILELFPDAQVICLIRDGRDAALSLMSQTWGPANAYGAAHLWRRALIAGHRSAKQLDSSSFLEVRYENLTGSVERELRRICGFLDESFEASMLVPNRLPSRLGTPFRLPKFDREVVDGNVEKWRTTMTLGQRRAFEAVAADELQMAGYALSTSQPSVQWHERIWWFLENKFKRLRWRSTTPAGRARNRTSLMLARARLRDR
jgi:Sulfotransferase family